MALNSRRGTVSDDREEWRRLIAAGQISDLHGGNTEGISERERQAERERSYYSARSISP